MRCWFQNTTYSCRPRPRRRFRLEGHPHQVSNKLDWGRGFIILLPQDAVPPGSDDGRDVIKPASGFVIQNRQTSCSMWCPMYGHIIRTRSAVCSEVPQSQFGEKARPHLGMDNWNCPTPVSRLFNLNQAVRTSSIQQTWHWLWI